MSDDVGRHNIKIYEAFNKFSSWMFFFFFLLFSPFARTLGNRRKVEFVQRACQLKICSSRKFI